MRVPSSGASEYIKQKLPELKGEIDKLTVIAEDAHTPFSMMDTRARQKIMETEDLTTL